MINVMPNRSPEPTAVGLVSSAIAVHAASRQRLNFFSLGATDDDQSSSNCVQRRSCSSSEDCWLAWFGSLCPWFLGRNMEAGMSVETNKFRSSASFQCIDPIGGFFSVCIISFFGVHLHLEGSLFTSSRFAAHWHATHCRRFICCRFLYLCYKQIGLPLCWLSNLVFCFYLCCFCVECGGL